MDLSIVPQTTTTGVCCGSVCLHEAAALTVLSDRLCCCHIEAVVF